MSGNGNGVSTLIDYALERVVAGTLIFRADLIEHAHPDFGLDMVADFHATAVITAVANIRARNEPVSVDSVRGELAARGFSGLEAWYPQLVAGAPDPIDPSTFTSRTASLVRLARKRQQTADAANEPGRLEEEIDDFALRDAEPSPPPTLPWKRAADLVAAIMERANDPWITMSLASDNLVRVRVGATVVLIGGSGSGKSSLALCVSVNHARHTGPVIIMSIELPGEEAGARIVGQTCEASWEDALCGRVGLDDMRRALDLPRLFVLDRRRATIANLEKCIDAVREEFPGESILVVFDYAQLLDSKERDARMKVSDAFAQIDDCAREKRFVALALSQMSRANTDRARKGEVLGAETTALGAESAAIERFATVTMAIGQSIARDDGSESVELSIGKSRMGQGDRVIPMRYVGKTGVWRVDGVAKSAIDVRANRELERENKSVIRATHAIVGVLTESKSPLSIARIVDEAGVNRTVCYAAVKSLQKDGKAVRVRGRKVGGAWPWWTKENADRNGVDVVPDGIEG